jgi:two-component system, OmpR family, sensor histidine kinase VicK
LTSPPPPTHSDTEEKIEVLYGSENIVKRTLADLPRIKETFDNCTDFTGPSVFIETPIWQEYVKMKDRGIRLRFITEITKDNIHYCNELMKVANLRHLDGVKGNFGIADRRDYGGGAGVQEAHTPNQLICSNVKAFVEQQQYFFETLWNKAIPAEQKIMEIEEGLIPIRTVLLEDQDEIIKQIKRKNNAAKKLSICTTFGGMQMSYSYLFDSYKNVVEKYKKGESKEGMRWLMNIEDNKENLSLVKTFLDSGIRLRHIKHMPPLSFGVTEREVAITIEKMEGGKLSHSFLLSSEPLYVSHFNSLFDELWKNGVDARVRLQEIKEGADADIEIIQNPSEALELYLDTVLLARQDIMLIFPTTNAFVRQQRTGIVHLLREIVGQHRVKVRILMPAHKITEEIIGELKKCSQEDIDIRFIEQAEDTQATFLTVDKKFSLVMEINNDSKETFDESIGLSIYSTSKAGVLSYVSIFESLWLQTELYERIKRHDNMQREFINVAAHELRTPIQPILGLSEVLKSKIIDDEQRSLIDVISRNAKRLQRLTEDILDITKIESQSLNLKKERFNLNEIIMSVLAEYENQTEKLEKNNVKIKLVSKGDFIVQGDKGRLTQVFSNLMSNAVKFTQEGSIDISLKNLQEDKDVVISVKDTGNGIDPDIMPRLFTKFATKSVAGTGLGLYICKSIVEAHQGSIWAQNNTDGKGATFSFTLPLSNDNQIL